MPNGYLVALGDAFLETGDMISGSNTDFTTDTVLGAGDWTWSGWVGGIPYTNEVEPGTYYLATDGNVYFSPDLGPVDTLDSATATNPPAYTDSDGVIEGTAGADVIDSGYSDAEGDQVDNGLGGGAGDDDTVEAGGGDDSVNAGSGADTVFGGAGKDTVEGGSGADLIYGDTDAEEDLTPTPRVITDANAADTGDGYTVTATPIGGSPSAANISYYGGGFGVAGAISDSDSGVTEQIGYDLATGESEALIVYLDADLDEITFSFEDLYTDSYGEEGHWAVYDDGVLVAEGDFTEDVLGSGTGAVTISGVGNFNQLALTANIQTDLTDGSDYMVSDISFTLPGIEADPYADSLSGGAGDDTIFGEGGDDTIYGGAGNDSLYGNEGNDTLAGGTGDDWMEGSNDSDTFFLEDSFGSDVILGGERGTDDDVVDLSNLTSGVTATYGNIESGNIVSGSNNARFFQIERLSLTDHDDVLDASAIASGVNADAGAGEDTLIGSQGDDSLTGGAGDDRFVMTTSGGTDTISDFDLSDSDLDGFFNDQIDVTGLTGGTGPGGLVTQADVVVSDDGFGNAQLTFPGGEQLILQGVTPAQINTPQQLYAAGIPCFTPGIRVATARGAIAVEHIREGDLLQTADNGFQPVIWSGRQDLSAAALYANPHRAPLVLRPGGPLGNERQLMVSPQHRFMLDQKSLGDIQHMNEAFLRTRLLQTLAPDHVVHAIPKKGISYIHLMTEVHQVIFAEGHATETFWPGPEALRGLCENERRKLFDLFPKLLLAQSLGGDLGRSYVSSGYSPLARVDLKRCDLRMLSSRPARAH